MKDRGRKEREGKDKIGIERIGKDKIGHEDGRGRPRDRSQGNIFSL